MSDELLEVKPEFMGFHDGIYPGAFPSRVEAAIKKIVASPCLHLFSGSSKIGDERIDFAHPNATRNMNVFDFIRNDTRDWNFVLVDAPYSIPEATQKRWGMNKYADSRGIADLNNRQRQSLESFFQQHTENILWFDYSSPLPAGFYRVRMIVYLPGAYRKIRALTWLKRKGERLA